MDVLAGQDLARYASNALHTPRIPRPVYTKTEQNKDLFRETDERNAALIDDFAFRRRLTSMQRESAFGGPFGGDAYAMIPRHYTPEDWYRQSNVPYNMQEEKQRLELYKWLDLFYRTHSLIPMMVDIFTRFPLVGVELKSPDRKLTQFYEDLFFDRLDYKQFLVDLGREYWTLGQAFPFGHFHEGLGIWTAEELLDPTLIKVESFPIIGGTQFALTPPDDLVQIAQKGAPLESYIMLEQQYPELLPFLRNKRDIPLSNVRLKQIALKPSTRDLHGTPILLRALRQLIHEEKLLAAQDAIAERLYAPLILVKLGVMDMGEGRPPFLPGPGEISQVRNEFELALASDFRLMVHHFGIDVQSVFGRETMPRFGEDLDRVDRKIMAVFGVNPSLLLGGAASQPYASSALQAEFLNQILRTYQHTLVRHFQDRAKIVAEAQEHFAYEKRGDLRIPIMEEVLTYDEDGNEIIEERHKLMIPDIKFKVLDLRDEATQRQFYQALKQQGVPIPDSELAMGMDFVFPEFLNQSEEEMIQKTVAQQEAKVKTYDILVAKGYPVPPELRQEIEGAQHQPPGPGEGTTLDVNTPGVGEEIPMPPPPSGPGMDTPGEGYDPTRGTAPEQSTQVMGPQIPGVPGQVGMMGIPGAPTPAIGPAGSGRAGASSEDESRLVFEEIKDGDEVVSLRQPLPRRAGKGTVPSLRETDEDFATVEADDDTK
jgi:hypothetical protein